MQRNILVVEENAITRRVIRTTLEQKRYEVREAPDGKTALAAIDERRPDLVLQALALPDIEGSTLIAQLRSRPSLRGIPILAVSGFVSGPEESGLSALGFDDVITKPIDPSRLAQVVGGYLPVGTAGIEPFGAGRRLLIIDDDPVQLNLMRFRFDRLGFEVTSAADGFDGLIEARLRPPHAIVSDVMMPRLDGFGLCMAISRDQTLSGIPVLLVTASYLDTADRELAQRAGAAGYVLRTPDLREIIEVLRASLDRPQNGTRNTTFLPADLESQRSERVIRQLERQVTLNAGMAQRCSALTAELAVLSSISEVLARQGDVDEALDDVLASCFDAGGIPAGALYLLPPGGPLRVRALGTREGWNTADLTTFFGERELLDAVIRAGEPTAIPSIAISDAQSQRILKRAGLSSLLVLPLARADERLGALVTVSRKGDRARDDGLPFAQGVANQIGQALVLTRAFADKLAAEERYRMLQEHAGSCVLVLARDGSIREVNRKGEIVLGAPRAELMGRLLVDLAPGQARDAVEQALARVWSGGATEIFEANLVRVDGRPILAEVAPAVVDLAAEKVALLVMNDITARDQLLRQTALNDKLATVGTLAAGVAHEINNPLTFVVANHVMILERLDSLRAALVTGEHGDVASLASGEASGAVMWTGAGTQLPGDATTVAQLLDEVRGMLTESHQGAERIAEIVRGLKTFARFDEDAMRAVCLDDVLNAAVRMSFHEIRYRARLVTDYAKDLPVFSGSSGKLTQVFVNLIVNAAQAIPEGHFENNVVRIVSRREGDWVRVDVTDSGGGIPESVLPRIFDPFFTTKPAGVGTGLGLSLCNEIVRKHGGKMEVVSHTGRGTTMSVLLPAAATSVASHGETPA